MCPHPTDNRPSDVVVSTLVLQLPDVVGEGSAVFVLLVDKGRTVRVVPLLKLVAGESNVELGLLHSSACSNVRPRYTMESVRHMLFMGQLIFCWQLQVGRFGSVCLL